MCNVIVKSLKYDYVLFTSYTVRYSSITNLFLLILYG